MSSDYILYVCKWRYRRMGNQSKRCRLPVWWKHCWWGNLHSYLTPTWFYDTLNDFSMQFRRVNGISMMCRAHQLVMEGFKWHFSQTVLTVWSAPNYCYRYKICAINLKSAADAMSYYRCGNVAAIFELDEHLSKNYPIFEAAPNVSDLRVRKWSVYLVHWFPIEQEVRGEPTRKPIPEYFLWPWHCYIRKQLSLNIPCLPPSPSTQQVCETFTCHA